MQSKKTVFNSIDEYIATFPAKTQTLLEKVRAIIHAAAPDAREKISYQIAAFELNGKNLVYFAGWEKHLSIYPLPSGPSTFMAEIAPYIDGKGTLKFPLNKPLPLKLIAKVVKMRVAENRQKTALKSSQKW